MVAHRQGGAEGAWQTDLNWTDRCTGRNVNWIVVCRTHVAFVANSNAIPELCVIFVAIL